MTWERLGDQADKCRRLPSWRPTIWVEAIFEAGAYRLLGTAGGGRAGAGSKCAT